MFYHVEGIVTDIESNLAVVDCCGVGFALNASANTISRLKTGEKAKLFVTESVSENAFELFGFCTKGEKRCFEMLTAVSGIGPKAAIAILSYNTPEALTLAVLNEDVKALTVAPGIGKKIAQRVILELKDKLGKEFSGEFSASTVTVPINVAAGDNKNSDAVAALMVLGYNTNEINSALKKIDTSGLSVEQIIKAVLRNMV